MSLSIHTNASAKTAINSLSNAGLANAKSSQRLSTGFRINSPADNAAGLQITNRMEKFLNSAGQAKQNIQESIAMLQIADGGLAESVKTLNAMKKLATQAANDTNSAADREAIQKEFSELGKELQNALNNTEYNSEKLFADGGKMRKELNFQSGTDAESSLKLDLNSVIAELTESVTKQAPKITGKSSSATGSLEKQAYDLDKAVTDTKSLVAGAEGVQKTLEHDFAASGNKAVAEIKIPEYKDALGKTVPEVVIALGAVITSANSNQMKDAVAALKTTHDAAVKAEATFQAKNSTGGGVMNMQLADKDLAMKADKKLSDVIDAYGAFRATLGANQNRLQSSSN
ncbi:flagellin, partial [Yersinia pestis]